MLDHGNLAIAGIFPSDTPGEIRGVAIYRKLPDTAKLVRTDPAVISGIVKIEAHPWASGTGVLAPGQPLK